MGILAGLAGLLARYPVGNILAGELRAKARKRAGNEALVWVLHGLPCRCCLKNWPIGPESELLALPARGGSLGGVHGGAKPPPAKLPPTAKRAGVAWNTPTTCTQQIISRNRGNKGSTAANQQSEFA